MQCSIQCEAGDSLSDAKTEHSDNETVDSKHISHNIWNARVPSQRQGGGRPDVGDDDSRLGGSVGSTDA